MKAGLVRMNLVQQTSEAVLKMLPVSILTYGVNREGARIIVGAVTYLRYI